MKGMTFAALVLLLACASLSNAQTTLAYDFTATNFGVDFNTGEPSPIEGVSGSFGVTFEPSDVHTQYTVAPDFVNFSLMGTDFTVENTAVDINDGDVIAFVFGGINAGANGISPFTPITDFWLVVFTDDIGNVLEIFSSFCFSPDTSSGFWCAQHPDVVVTPQILDPGALIEQLSIAVTGVGPGSSLSDKLVQAKAYLDAGDSQAACEMLNAFLNQVRAQRGKKLEVEFADQLTTEVMDIMEAIGCG